MNNNKSKVLLSLLAGATAGVVAGLLLAPDSGKKSRASLLSSASKWGGDLDKIFRDGLGRLQEMTSTLGMGGQSGSGTAKSGADDMFDEFSSGADGGTNGTASAGGSRKSGGAGGASTSGGGSSSGSSSSSSGSGSSSMGGGSSASSMGSGSTGGSPS